MIKRADLLANCVLAATVEVFFGGFALLGALLAVAAFGGTNPTPVLAATAAFLCWLPTVAYLNTRSLRDDVTQQLSVLKSRLAEVQQDRELAGHGATEQLGTLQRDLELARSDARSYLLTSWLAEIPQLSYTSELDVEFKFVYPLLRWLGFEAHNLRPRVPVSVQIGRQNVAGEADWVIYQGSDPYIVVEAKSASVSLDPRVLGQARSYAYALGAPLYLVTNGHSVQLHRRGITEDECLLTCTTGELQEHWLQLLAAIAV